MAWVDYCKQFIPLIKQEYSRRMGKPCDIDRPRTFTEKIQWMKVYDSTFTKSYCTNKITLHQFCKRILNNDLCIPIVSTCRSTTELDFNTLPKQCVIKCNHGCKMNYIVHDSSRINIASCKQLLSNWLQQDFSMAYGYELHYKLIPHEILVETYMNDGHDDLIDYKFYCFNGTPLFCQVIQDRHRNMTLSHYDVNWNYAPKYDWVEYASRSDVRRPKLYSDMIAISSQLAQPFKFVRVDLYEINHRIYLGELTFTPNSGYHKFRTTSTDSELGELLKL